MALKQSAALLDVKCLKANQICMIECACDADRCDNNVGLHRRQLNIVNQWNSHDPAC